MELKDLEAILERACVHYPLPYTLKEQVKACYEQPPILGDAILELQKEMDSLDVQLTEQRTVLAKTSKEFIEKTGGHIDGAFNSPKADEHIDILFIEGDPYVKTHNLITGLIEKRREIQKMQKAHIEQKGKFASYTNELDIWAQKAHKYLDEFQKINEAIITCEKEFTVPKEVLNAYRLFENFIEKVLSKRHELVDVLGINKTIIPKSVRKRSQTDLRGYVRSNTPIQSQIEEVVNCVLTFCEEDITDETDYCERFTDVMNTVGLLSDAQNYDFVSASRWGRQLNVLVEKPELIGEIVKYEKKINDLNEKKGTAKLNVYQQCQSLIDFFEN